MERAGYTRGNRMTEWMGIKVGELYKKTGRGSRGAPLVMVVSIEACKSGSARWKEIVHLTTLESGKLESSWLSNRSGTTGRPGINVDGDTWPYKRISA